MGGLAKRVASALVLAPPVLAAFYYGPPYSDVLVLLAAAILAWEWARLCDGTALGRGGLAVISVVVAAAVLAAWGRYDVALWLLLGGALAAALAAVGQGRATPAWYGLGVIYLGVACLAVLWLRDDPVEGGAVVLWLIAVVWATDIGAYLAGRSIGGPKLAPRISPNKTWAGLAGGVVAAAAAGMVTARLYPGQHWLLLGLVSSFLALVAQGGDLFESAIKRRFGVKDSSNLIPGHGGLLDRVDGVLSTAVVVAVIIWLQGASL